MFVVGGVSNKGPLESEWCEIDESLTSRKCRVIKDSELDEQVRPKFGFRFINCDTVVKRTVKMKPKV